MQYLAARMAEIDAFHVMDILARARELERQGHDIVHMEIGEPDFPTAQPIVEAAMAALREGHTHYTPALGLPELQHRGLTEHVLEHHPMPHALEPLKCWAANPGRVPY